jgi:hypothetical protein
MSSKFLDFHSKSLTLYILIPLRCRTNQEQQQNHLKLIITRKNPLKKL